MPRAHAGGMLALCFMSKKARPLFVDTACIKPVELCMIIHLLTLKMGKWDVWSDSIQEPLLVLKSYGSQSRLQGPPWICDVNIECP